MLEAHLECNASAHATVGSDREVIWFAQTAIEQFARAHVSEKMLTSVTCVMTKQRKLECLRLQKKGTLKICK